MKLAGLALSSKLKDFGWNRTHYSRKRKSSIHCGNQWFIKPSPHDCGIRIICHWPNSQTLELNMSQMWLPGLAISSKARWIWTWFKDQKEGWKIDMNYYNKHASIPNGSFVAFRKASSLFWSLLVFGKEWQEFIAWETWQASTRHSRWVSNPEMEYKFEMLPFFHYQWLWTVLIHDRNCQKLFGTFLCAHLWRPSIPNQTNWRLRPNSKLHFKLQLVLKLTWSFWEWNQERRGLR